MSILFFSFFFYIYINSPSPSSPHVRSVYHIYINVVKYSFMFPHAFLQKIKNVHAFCQSQVHATSNPVLFSDCQPKSYPSRCYHNLTFLFFYFLFPYFFFFFFLYHNLPFDDNHLRYDDCCHLSLSSSHAKI